MYKFKQILLLITVFFTCSSFALANYQLQRPVFSGGGGKLSGTNYAMRTVIIGQNMPAAHLSNTSYATQANSGYVLMLAPNNAPKFNGDKDYFVADNLTVNPHEFNGATIAEVLDRMPGTYSDIDHDTHFGLAVTGVDNTNGQWQFTTNDGSSWTDITDASESNALLLADDNQTRLRFLPNMDYMGGYPGDITFRIWDQYRGNSGQTNVDLNQDSWVYTVSLNQGLLLGNVMAVPVAVPSLNEWGLFFLCGLLLSTSLRMIFRQRQLSVLA